MNDQTTEPTVETFAEWYGNGDTGEEYVSDGMGNGACLYRLDNGDYWHFEWTDQGFDYCGKTTREEWDAFVAAAYPPEEEPHVGHYSRLGGTWWCDTCNSPYCELA